MLRGKFTTVNVYIKKQERFQINILTLQLKELEEELDPMLIQKEVIKIRVEIKEIGTRKTIERYQRNQRLVL